MKKQSITKELREVIIYLLEDLQERYPNLEASELLAKALDSRVVSNEIREQVYFIVNGQD